MKIGSLVLLSVLLNTSAQLSRSADSVAPSEPQYQGKPLTYWLIALEPDRPTFATPKQAEAEEAIHMLGPDAIPFVLQYRRGTRAQRLEVIRHACAILEPDGDIKILEALRDPDASVRETALEVISKTAIALAMDDIAKSLTDQVRSVRNAAILALVRLAPDRDITIEALIEALQPSNETAEKVANSFSREEAALTLATLGAKARAAVPELTKLLEDPKDDIREAAATALWKIDQSPAAIASLAERLSNARDYQTLVRIMKLLGEIGPPAKSVVPLIQQKIEDPGVSFVPATLDLSQVALDVLAKIDPQAAGQSRKKLGAGSADKR